MPTISQSRYLCKPVRLAGPPEWELLPPIAHESQEMTATRRAWRVILETLRAWEQDPTVVADEGIDPPARETIRAAINLATEFQFKGWPPPDHVICDPNGGIVFRRHEGDISEEVSLTEQGQEYRLFDGTRLIQRR